jgi:hypothetical protein
MRIPWRDIKIPKRYIRIDYKTIKKFPVFWKLFADQAYDIFLDKRIINKLMMKNLLETGPNENTKLDFAFKIDEGITPIRLEFEMRLHPEDLNFPYVDSLLDIQGVIYDPDDEMELFEFFKKLNSKINSMHPSYIDKINDILKNSKLQHFIKQDEKINKLPEFQDEDLTKFAPKIEFIQKGDFDENGEMTFYATDSINLLSAKIRGRFINNSSFSKEEEEKYTDIVKEGFEDIEEQIKEMLEKIDEKDMIDLSEL